MAKVRTAPGALDRIVAFRFVYLAIFAYVVCSVFGVQATQGLLVQHFRSAVDRAVHVSPADGPVIPQIQDRMFALLHESPWVRWGGVRVTALVLGADGITPIYLGGRTLPPPPNLNPDRAFDEAARLLPAIVTVDVDLPPGSVLGASIWVLFGAIFVPVLFVQQRRTEQREQAILDAALRARDATIERARSIQGELEKVRRRLAQLEPAERAHAAEIATLEHEREQLQQRLAELSQREQSLKERASAPSLQQERRALEDLLDEAVQDLEEKDNEIQTLQERLKRAAKESAARGRARASEQLGRRMRTLYRNLEIDERAIQDIVALGDEALRLRAEEALKRLDENPESAGVRRKVGGLPSHLSIFELGFAGKGRIYYTRGKQRAFRVLSAGGKASQKADLEYLSRLSLD